MQQDSWSRYSDEMTGDIAKPDLPLIEQDSAKRKNMPLARGVLDYFPAALMAVAEVSMAGNEKHNPGEALHHSRGKSMDHADCVIRHLAERGHIETLVANGTTYKIRASAFMAWRALALLQQEIEDAGEVRMATAARQT